MAAPIRTCIGCRQRASAVELVRLVLVEGRVSAVGPAAQGGRGASIHPREACVVAAVKAHAFARAFRAPVSISMMARPQQASSHSPGVGAVENSKVPNVVDDAVRSLMRDIEIAQRVSTAQSR